MLVSYESLQAGHLPSGRGTIAQPSGSLRDAVTLTRAETARVRGRLAYTFSLLVHPIGLSALVARVPWYRMAAMSLLCMAV